jgi:uncharacterized repeat protein (TIGR03803 family)
VAATQQFTATGTYSDNLTQNLTTEVSWASTDVSAAAISNTADSRGLATGLVVGSSSVSAALDGVTSPAVTLTVTAHAEKVLYSFAGGADGANPEAGLLQAADGDFYATASSGANSAGTVFKLTPAGVVTVLYSFTGVPDGKLPTSGLIQAVDGNFYGTTFSGGANDSGTIFKLTPGGVEAVLYSFAGFPDGANPNAGLIQAADGDFYGATGGGGGSASSVGTLFKLTPAGVETVLHTFVGFPDGANPEAGLIQASDGNFYGTTYYGGANGSGTVFKLTLAGVETVLYSFTGIPDGANPYAGLIQAVDGNFYGTTYRGGANGAGTVFKLTPAGVETLLYSFTGGTDATNPNAGLIQAADGNFYGTTYSGGANGAGTIFKLTPAGVETVLYSFTGIPDGANPNAELIQAVDGYFYGTTYSGGASNLGAVFKF